jgi:HK97 family phage major capsid protein
MAPVVAKSRTEGEFRVEAEKLRQKILTEENLGLDELNKLTDQIRVLRLKADAAAGFTPDEAVNDDPDLKDLVDGQEAVRARVEGGSELVFDEEEQATGRDGRTRVVGTGDDTAIKPRYRSRYISQYEKMVRAMYQEFGGPGNYLLAIARAGDPRERQMNVRQKKVHEAMQAWHVRTIVGTASDASGGEFLLPLEQVPTIFSVPNVQPGILQIARRFPMAGRTLRIPYVKQTSATNARPMAGIANIAWGTEANDKDIREPAFQQRLLTAYKAQAYAEIGDETIEDDFTGMLPSTLQTLVGGQVVNFMNEQFTIDGNGTGVPLGALNTANPSLIIATRKTASQINIEDVVGMFSQFAMTGSRNNQRWLINRTALPQLLQLKLSGNTLVTFLSNLRDEPPMQLFGIPVEVCDLLSTLGQYDFALVNGEFYAYGARQQLTVQSSIHYKFRQDITAYRFYARGGGIPIPDGTYAYKSPSGTKVATFSPFVILGDTYGS